MPQWLEDAVFYEIYPQSFYDTNGDGIGDFEGIIQKLDYIAGLGCNALWINPCFDSPFKDAGYDVRDYKKTAPRYGTNDDLKRLFAEAHKRGIRVLLDLVPGHTSEEHEWFIESKKASPNEYWNRFIWTDHCFKGAQGIGFIGGESDRSGTYIINFFKCQPALNYGWLKPAESWQLPMDHPDSIATREAMKDVMRYWLDAGCDGFRVDIAFSLVKGDDGERTGSSMLWRNVRSMLDREYPEAAIVSEWSYPKQAINAGFHMDFFLDFAHNQGGIKSLFRDYPFSIANEITGKDKSFFKKDAPRDIRKFVDEYLYHYEAVKHAGFMSLVTCNHDLPRLSANMDKRELSLAYAFIFTMPGVPFLYYGDEIGMRYLNLPTKEGGYFRTGSRTPMQWNRPGPAGKNFGFSTADANKLYLPVDSAPDAPTVEAQEQDPASLLRTVRELIKLRHAEPELRSKPNLEILYAETGKLPFVYKRGSLVMAVNPSGDRAKVDIASVPAAKNVYAIGKCSFDRGLCDMEGQSFGVWKTGN
jgi:maltose alpha-D-glucosyltransferase/alpha-amylase